MPRNFYRASKGVAMNQGEAPAGYVTRDEACRQLKMTFNRVRDLKEAGELDGIVRKEGLTKRLYISQASIDAYLQRGE